MNLKSKRRYDAQLCIRQFRRNHPELSSNAAAAAAFDAVDAAIDEAAALASGRLHATNTFLGASAERQSRRAELHELLSDLSRVSKTLDRTLYPDIAAQLKMGRLNSYQELTSLARNAIEVIGPIKQAFIDRGAPESITEDIQDQINALEAAAARRNKGMGSQIARNTDLRIVLRKGMDQVRILDGILNLLLKRQPGVLAEWNAAKRLQHRGASRPQVDAGLEGDTSGDQPVYAGKGEASPRADDRVIHAVHLGDARATSRDFAIAGSQEIAMLHPVAPCSQNVPNASRKWKKLLT